MHQTALVSSLFHSSRSSPGRTASMTGPRARCLASAPVPLPLEVEVQVEDASVEDAAEALRAGKRGASVVGKQRGREVRSGTAPGKGCVLVSDVKSPG